MRNHKGSLFRWLTLGGVLAALASAQCGSTTSTSGTETHWLSRCDADTDCGDLRCYCGVCTEDCTDDDACEAHADTAVCSNASATDFADGCSDGADPKVCVRDTDLTSGGSTSSTGGSGGTGGSSGATGAAGSAGAPACAPEDARAVGTGSCEQPLGSRWTGQACESLYACECEGADCDTISETYEGCAEAHADCFDNATCYDERQELIELLNANKSCTAESDCTSHSVGCGVSEDDCTGTVYSNNELDRDEVQALAARLSTCSAAFEGTGGCAICERVPQPPQCVEGRCMGSDPCALQQSAMASFISYNSACETVDDCTIETVGCGVTQDGCTGAVYLNEGFDSTEFNALREDLHACSGDDGGGCALCEREVTGVACVSGQCMPE